MLNTCSSVIRNKFCIGVHRLTEIILVLANISVSTNGGNCRLHCWAKLSCRAGFSVICIVIKVNMILRVSYFHLLKLLETGVFPQRMAFSQTAKKLNHSSWKQRLRAVTQSKCIMNFIWVFFISIQSPLHPGLAASVFDVQLDFSLLHWKWVFWNFYVGHN